MLKQEAQESSFTFTGDQNKNTMTKEDKIYVKGMWFGAIMAVVVFVALFYFFPLPH